MWGKNSRQVWHIETNRRTCLYSHQMVSPVRLSFMSLTGERKSRSYMSLKTVDPVLTIQSESNISTTRNSDFSGPDESELDWCKLKKFVVIWQFHFESHGFSRMFTPGRVKGPFRLLPAQSSKASICDKEMPLMQKVRVPVFFRGAQCQATFCTCYNSMVSNYRSLSSRLGCFQPRPVSHKKWTVHYELQNMTTEILDCWATRVYQAREFHFQNFNN